VNAAINERYQFLRKGYFTLDNKESFGRLVFNRTVTLKDAWAKEQKKG
jgi:glutaminyl-tRNA synthetase